MISKLEKIIKEGWSDDCISNAVIINNISLIDCVQSCNLICIKWLLDHGADIHAESDDALRWASEYGHSEVVKLLLEHGADVHTKDDSALRWASLNGHLGVVKILLEHGADVHTKDDSALRSASNNGHSEVVKILLEHWGMSLVPINTARGNWKSEMGTMNLLRY